MGKPPEDLLPNPDVLRRRSDFTRLHERGKALRAADVVVVYLRTEPPRNRYAVIASRKVGSAVRRNRAKRILREAHRSIVRQGGMVEIEQLLIARPAAAASSSQAVCDQLRVLYRREGLLYNGTEHPSGDHSDSQ